MNKKYYDLLGVTEEMTDEQIAERYEALKKKYSEERFLEGEAGNEAAQMLGKIDVAYNEIMTERRESAASSKTDSSYANVEQLIREGKYKEKIEYDRRQSEAQTGGNSYRSGPARPVDDSSYSNGNNGNGMSQMGGTGGLCESCATCCACNMLFNCCMNACCGCR